MLKKIKPSYKIMDEMDVEECYKKKYGQCSIYLPINASNIEKERENDITYCQQLYIGMRIASVIENTLNRAEDYIIDKLNRYYKDKINEIPFPPPIDTICWKFKKDLIFLTLEIDDINEIIRLDPENNIRGYYKDEIQDLILTQQFIDMANEIRTKVIEVLNRFFVHERLINKKIYERYLDLAYGMSLYSLGKLPSTDCNEGHLFDGRHRNCVALHGKIEGLIIDDISKDCL